MTPQNRKIPKSRRFSKVMEDLKVLKWYLAAAAACGVMMAAFYVSLALNAKNTGHMNYAYAYIAWGILIGLTLPTLIFIFCRDKE